jgi:hypothetical protein
MNDAERVIARYERVAPILIVIAVVIGFLVAGGAIMGVPVAIAIGVLLAWMRLKGVSAVREALVSRRSK